MPLPTNTQMSLQGHSRPGDTVQSKPKQAMIVRMTAETLEALAAFPPNTSQVDVEFGANPGIHIGEAFFSMRALKENSPHEIYLRASQPNKSSGPLKLYANVTGKFTVERQLVKDVEDRVRESTMEAEKLRRGRGVVVLEAPPTSAATNPKKRKAPTTTTTTTVVRKTGEHARNTSLSTPVSALTSRVASPLPSKAAPTVVKEAWKPIRNRMIHCLAASPRTTDDVLRLLGPKADQDTKNYIMELLEEVGEAPAASKKSTQSRSQQWQLKTRSWLEVRPYAWPSLSEQDRTNLARQARMALSDLKIPESDPVWDHVKYRQAPSPTATASAPAPSPVGRAGLPPRPADTLAPPSRAMNGTSTAKEKKAKAKTDAAKPKAKAGDPIMAKDESLRAARLSEAKAAASSAHDSDSTPLAVRSLSVQSGTAVRRPGSGFKLGSPSVTSPALTPNPTPPHTATRAELGASSHKKGASSLDATGKSAGSRVDSPNPGRARVSQPMAPPATVTGHDRGERSDRERERDRGRDRERDQDRDRGGRTERDSLTRAKQDDKDALSRVRSEARGRDSDRDTDREDRAGRVRKERPRESDRDTDREELIARARKERAREADREMDREQRIARLKKERMRESDRETDREERVAKVKRERPSDAPARPRGEERPSERERERERERKREDRDAEANGTLKRKAVKREEGELESDDRERPSGTLKRRRLDERGDGPSSRPSRTDDAREPSARPATSRPAAQRERERSPSMRPKIKKESSPLPPSLKRASDASTSTSAAANGAASKRQRRSPIYTSSSDDDGAPPTAAMLARERERALKAKAKAQAAAAAKIEHAPSLSQSTATSSSDSARARHAHGQAAVPVGALPATGDRAALRAQYRRTYPKYIRAFQRVVAQRTAFERALRAGAGAASDAESEEDEEDVEMMEPEQLQRSIADYRRWHGELERIRGLFADGEQGREGSD